MLHAPRILHFKEEVRSTKLPICTSRSAKYCTCHEMCTSNAKNACHDFGKRTTCERCHNPSGLFFVKITTTSVFAEPLHSFANPFAKILLFTSRKRISKGEAKHLNICNHCFRYIFGLREPFANLSPGYQESLENMLCTIRNSKPFSRPFAKFPQMQFSCHKE